jgi:hypothetical protein
MVKRVGIVEAPEGGRKEIVKQFAILENRLQNNFQTYPNRTLIRSFLTLLVVIFYFAANLKAQGVSSDSTVIVRLEAIHKMLQHDEMQTNRWWWSWLAGYSAATVGQGVAGMVSDNLQTRQDLFLGATTAFIGAAGQFLTPVTLSGYTQQISLLPENTANERLGKLNASEEFLQKRALAETKGRSWQMHAATGAVNVGSGLITWFGFDRTWQDGLINFALNTVVTEAQIWSQPIIAKRGLASYQKHFISENRRQSGRYAYKYTVSAGANGILVRMTF